MSQDDLIIANQTFPATRTDINSNYQALGSLMSGASAPSTTYTYMWWADTTNGVLKQRNSSDSAWVIRDTLSDDRVVTKTTTYSVVAGDMKKTILCSASGAGFTITLLAAATAGDGFEVTFKKTDSTSNKVTLDGNASETIDGALTITLDNQYEAVTLICDGSNWNRKYSSPFTMTRSELTLASATTTDLGSVTTNMIAISGTITITGLGSSASVLNPVYFLRFTGALTLTHNGTSLIIPGAANVTTADGDTAIVEYLGSGNWKVLSYTRVSGRPLTNLVTIQRQLFIPAREFETAVFSPGAAKADLATGGSYFNAAYIALDPTTAEYVNFNICLPKDWDLGAIQWQIVWSHAATATNFGVKWGVDGRSNGDGDAFSDTVVGTSTVTDTGGTTDTLYITPKTSLTIAGTPAAGDVQFMRAGRSATDGADTMTIDARLHGVIIYYNAITLDQT